MQVTSKKALEETEIKKLHRMFKEQLKECLLEQKELDEISAPLYPDFIEERLTEEHVTHLFLYSLNVSLVLSVAFTPAWFALSGILIKLFSQVKKFLALHEENKLGIIELEQIYEEEVSKLEELRKELLALIMQYKKGLEQNEGIEEYCQMIEEYYQGVMSYERKGGENNEYKRKISRGL